MTPNHFSQPIPKDCPELGIEVPVASIDHQLRKLWEQDEARTNASLMNLVVCSEQRGALLRNTAVLRELTREHACRAILVEVDRDEATPSIRAWVTAHCHLAHGRKSVCCEQIALFLTGRVTGRFRNTVFAHLNSDLPLVFWWQGGLSELLTERMVAVIDRLIVDSAGWADPAAAFDRLAELAAGNPDLILHDHEWSRSWQFRLGVAALFDDPAVRARLPEIDAVEITGHPSHRNCQLQMLAWLATQAGWADVGDGASPGSFRSSTGRPIRVSLADDPDGAPISSLVLRAGERSATVTRGTGDPHVRRCLRAPGYEVCSLSPADPDSAEALLGQQLARGGANSLFRKILPRFRAMLSHSPFGLLIGLLI